MFTLAYVAKPNAIGILREYCHIIKHVLQMSLESVHDEVPLVLFDFHGEYLLDCDSHLKGKEHP